MLLPSLPFIGSTRAGALQLPGLLSSAGGIDLTPPNLSVGASAFVIAAALLLVWATLRRTP